MLSCGSEYNREVLFGCPARFLHHSHFPLLSIRESKEANPGGGIAPAAPAQSQGLVWRGLPPCRATRGDTSIPVPRTQALQTLTGCNISPTASLPHVCLWSKIPPPCGHY